MTWLRSIGYGLRNLWWFLPVVWRYREWDWAYSYYIFAVALRHLGDTLDGNRRHTCAERDAKRIRITLCHLSRIGEYDDRNSPKRWLELDEYHWDSAHLIMRKHARRWWD
jgi:hypothetical protein